MIFADGKIVTSIINSDIISSRCKTMTFIISTLFYCTYVTFFCYYLLLKGCESAVCLYMVWHHLNLQLINGPKSCCNIQSKSMVQSEYCRRSISNNKWFNLNDKIRSHKRWLTCCRMWKMYIKTSLLLSFMFSFLMWCVTVEPPCIKCGENLTFNQSTF